MPRESARVCGGKVVREFRFEGVRNMNPLDSLQGTVVAGLVLTVVMVLLVMAIGGGV
jgi:hypothetical protein